jgi:hypothetical protein
MKKFCVDFYESYRSTVTVTAQSHLTTSFYISPGRTQEAVACCTGERETTTGDTNSLHMLPTTALGGMTDLLLTTSPEAVAATVGEAEEVALIQTLNVVFTGV